MELPPSVTSLLLNEAMISSLLNVNEISLDEASLLLPAKSVTSSVPTIMVTVSAAEGTSCAVYNVPEPSRFVTEQFDVVILSIPNDVTC